MSKRRASLFSLVLLGLSNCVSTSIQGYADRDLPAKPVTHLVALVNASDNLAISMLSSLTGEGAKHRVVVDDARAIFPPTRQYTDVEVKQGLASQKIDALLILDVGDSGVRREYAGTILTGNYSGTTFGSASVNTFGNVSTINYSGNQSGSFVGSSTPITRYSRETTFKARLIEASTGRNLWVGSGQVSAGGALFVGNGVSASNSVAAIFNDLQAKGIISPAQ